MRNIYPFQVTVKRKAQVLPLSRALRQILASHGLPVYAAALSAVTVALAASLLVAGVGLRARWWELGLLAGAALLLERQPVRISDNTEITVSVLPILFAAVAFGPLDAVIVAAGGIVGDFRRPYLRWVLWTNLRALAGGAAGLAAMAVEHYGESSSSVLLVSAVCAAALTEAVVDISLGAGVVALRTGSWREYLRSVRLALLGTVPLYAPVLVALVYAYGRLGPLSWLLFFGPAFAAHRFYRLYEEQKGAAQDLETANLRLERANLSFAAALVATLDARDRYTAGHSAAVAIYARDIASRMGLVDRDQQLAYLCGLVHDIGKVGLPPGLLEKRGPLTLEERRVMETHSVIGERILANVDDYAQIASVVRHHHERVDGMGYPDRLRTDAIPLFSRILAVADAYNAMTSDRPYRDAMPSRVARLRLAQAVDSQFDTAVVAAFEAILASAPEDYRLAAQSQFDIDSSSLRMATVTSPSERAAAIG
jgi:putative nucleotidyltransferase with HDIG domain